MPLIKSKSKKAFKHNVEAEMEAGKPVKQSLAIAYGIQRKNKVRKMADGGEVKKEYPDPYKTAGEVIAKTASGEAGQKFMANNPFARKDAKKMAHGGMVEKPMSITEAILRKRKSAILEENALEMPNQYDELNEEAAMDPLYDIDVEDQPEDSNLIQPEIESDKHDKISRIRARMRSIRG